MDKRGARILAVSLIGTLIVIVLIFLASRLTQPSCELIIIEQTQLRSASVADWPKAKPIRSHDKSTLFKISAYLEYNIQASPKDKSSLNAPGSGATSLSQADQDPSQQQQQQQQSVQQLHPPQLNQAANPQIQPQSNQVAQVPAQASSQQPLAAIGTTSGKSPNPSVPQSGFTNQQLANSSMLTNLTGADSKSEKPRFLPIELEDIEIKKVEDNKYSYTLNFNCSTMKLTFVRKPERVYVEKITMELKPKSHKKSTCELQLQTPEVFSTEVSAHDGWARYYCDRPLKYSCHHNSSKNPGQPGVLLAELHINGIEFETSGSGGQTGGNNSPLKHKGRDFEGARGKYCS